MPDLTTYTWRQLAPATHPTATQNFAFCWAGTKGVLFGGGDLPGPSDETWVLEGEEWRQLSPATPPSARQTCSIAWDGARVLLFGGVDSGLSLLNDTWSLDLGTEEWTELFPANDPGVNTLYGFGPNSMIWDGSKFVLQIQRLTGGLLVPETWGYAAADWTDLTPANQPNAPALNGRCFPSLTFGGGKTFLFGGRSAGNNQPIVDDTIAGQYGATWDFETGDWSLDTIGSYPNTHPDSSGSGHAGYARDLVPIAHTQDAEVLLFGGHIYDLGSSGTLSVADTWMLDNTAWTELAQSVHPAKRYSHGLIYDDVLDRFVLYAGYTETGASPTHYTDTWVFEPPPEPPVISVASIRASFGLGS